MESRRDYLKSVFKDTVEISNTVCPFNGKSIIYKWSENMITPKRTKYRHTPLMVINEDCVSIANKFIKHGKVGLINMACSYKPGGGVINGATAQEEHLCRCSNLYQALDISFYPIESESVIVSTDVVFFKDGNYDYIEEPWECITLSVAAVNLRNRDQSINPFTEEIKEITLKKIQTLVHAAYESGVDHLILSALGCGAYGNPPDEVAQLFRRVLIEDGWRLCFASVTFAIIEDKNSSSNVETFSKIVCPERINLVY